MSTPGFPKDPDDGTIFELQSGLFFIYDASTKSWSRAEGGVLPAVATPMTDGLMSAVDFTKLNRVVVPPPDTTITTEDCDLVFTEGIISITGGDQFLTVDGIEQQDLFVHVDNHSRLLNTAANIDEDNAVVVNRDLHLHSYSFNFGIDVPRLFQFMVDNGKFRVSTKQGERGVAGDRGADGEDELSFGPDGPKGISGANAVFVPGLFSEAIPFKVKDLSKRAIVDITAERVNENENYLVVTRANIGNPDACPNVIRMSTLAESTWLVALEDLTKNTNTTLTVDDCRVCTGEVYYLDVQPMLDEIKAEFTREAERIKTGFEEIVVWWLTVMAGVFDEQKSALCCALEHCRSQTRNVNTRRYIEQSRIQAAISDHSIIVEGDPFGNPTTTEVVETIMSPACEPDGFGTTNKHGLPNNADPIGGHQCVPFVTKVDGIPRKFGECPPGFTPRDVYREFIKSEGTPAGVPVPTPAVPAEISLSSLRSDQEDIITMVQEISDPQPEPKLVRATTQTLDLDVEVPKVTNSVQLYQTILSDEDAKYEIQYVNELGADPVESITGMYAGIKSTTIDGYIVNKFSDDLSPGIYYLCVSNESDITRGFELVIASQNAIFQQGHGAGWSDDLIQEEKQVINDISYAGNTIIKCSQGPLAGHPWWLKMRVLESRRPGTPYSTRCGATGPRWSGIDGRICAELPVTDGNPITRRFGKVGNGQYRDWHTSKCGGYVVPDAVSLRIGGHFSELGDLILCRVDGGSYSGGFNYRGKSAQVLIEQLDTVRVRHYSPIEPSNFKSSVPGQDDSDGSTKFKCTLLAWDGVDCDSDMKGFATVTVDAVPSPWNVEGQWHLDGEEISFYISGIDNDYDVLGASHVLKEHNFVIDDNKAGTHKKVSLDVPKGTYIATLTTCCLKVGNGYIGHVRLRYNMLDKIAEKQFPSLGVIDKEDAARAAYQGLTMQIDHSGGEMSAELVNQISRSTTGQIIIRLIEVDQIRKPVPTFKPQITGDTCQMHVGHLSWFKQGWDTGNCTGASINVAGQDYIIIKRHGRVGSLACAAKFVDPSIAWPTIDGRTLIDVPQTGSVIFKRDTVLEDEIRQAIRDRRYSNSVGDIDSVNIVLFPTVRNALG